MARGAPRPTLMTKIIITNSWKRAGEPLGHSDDDINYYKQLERGRGAPRRTLMMTIIITNSWKRAGVPLGPL